MNKTIDEMCYHAKVRFARNAEAYKEFRSENDCGNCNGFEKDKDCYFVINEHHIRRNKDYSWRRLKLRI